MSTFTVYAVPKDRSDDMTDGKGLPVGEPMTEEEANDYVIRNSSPDNPDRYEVRAASSAA